MATVKVRPAQLTDIPSIKARQQDTEELWASFRHTPGEALEFGICNGMAWLGEVDGVPLGIFGVAPYGDRHGVIWAVFTDEIERHPVAFLRACVAPLDSFKREYLLLVNYVDQRNTKVIRWLKWLGFTIYPAQPFGADQLPFHRFEWSHV